MGPILQKDPVEKSLVKRDLGKVLSYLPSEINWSERYIPTEHSKKQGRSAMNAKITARLVCNFLPIDFRSWSDSAFSRMEHEQRKQFGLTILYISFHKLNNFCILRPSHNGEKHMKMKKQTSAKRPLPTRLCFLNSIWLNGIVTSFQLFGIRMVPLLQRSRFNAQLFATGCCSFELSS